MQSPWSNKQRALTNEEWRLLKEWRQHSENKPFRQGERRGDGRIFWGYTRRCNGGEIWKTQESFSKAKALARAATKKKQSLPEERERLNAIGRHDYATSPTRKANQLARIKAWREKNRHKDRATAARHIAKKKGQTHPDIDRITERELYRQAEQISRDTGIQHQVDHIIPLCCGGWHHHQNLQILPKVINCQKNANPFWQSDIYKDWRGVPEYLWPANLAGLYKHLSAK